MSADEALRRDVMANWQDRPSIVYVAFGPQEWEALTPVVASKLLTLFKQRQPALFGSYLAEALTGVKPSGRKS